LVHHFESCNNFQEALCWQQRDFNASPSLDKYERLKRISQKTGDWEGLRLQVMRDLEDQNRLDLEDQNRFDLLVLIAISEQEVEQALAFFAEIPEHKRYSYLDALAKLTQQKNPQTSIELYQELAEHWIAQRNRGAYKEAARYLKEARRLYRDLNQASTWKSIIQSFRSQYHALRALQDEFTKAGL
jgi:uncharacterized Zn finger protein